MVTVVLMILATILSVFFIIKVGQADRMVVAEVVISKAWSNKFSRTNLEEKKEAFLKKNEKFHMASAKKAEKKVIQWDKQIADYAKSEQAYMSGTNFSFWDSIPLFGYQLLIDNKVDSENDMFRKLVNACEHSGYVDLQKSEETGEKKNSTIYAYYLLSMLLSNAYVGLILACVLAAIMLSVGREMSNVLVFALAGFGGLLLIGYLPFDELKSKADKRQEAIDRDFPNVISKIALLVTAGMNITKAIEEASNSGETEMYIELQKTLKEINQSVSVETAFVHLQSRCNNKYLDKMVTIITKSYVAGNTNLADNLKSINDECWLEKKHSSRRMGELIQTKLFIPTMLMFVGILIVIIVPTMSGFSF